MFAHSSCVRARAVLLLIGMKQAQRQEWEEILPLGYVPQGTRERRSVHQMWVDSGTRKGGAGEVRQKLAEDDLAPRLDTTRLPAPRG